jgi:hypothetical protein
MVRHEQVTSMSQDTTGSEKRLGPVRTISCIFSRPAWQAWRPTNSPAQQVEHAIGDSRGIAIERFVVSPQPLLTIEREFSTGETILVRAAVFGLLHVGRVRAAELRTDALLLLTQFVATGQTS